MRTPSSWSTAGLCFASAVVCALPSCALDRDGVAGIEAAGSAASAGGGHATGGAAAGGERGGKAGADSAGGAGGGAGGAGGAACGDGVKDPPEECDDGNVDPADGCNACILDCGQDQFKDAVEGHCYQYFDDSVTWFDAKAGCERWGGTLAALTTPAERALVLPQIGDAETWLGAADDPTQGTLEGIWIWITGEPFTAVRHAEPWHPLEPTGTADENCAEIRPDGLFNDLDCGKDRTFLCERVP